jgi:anion-transporting  ArsA/GET3 family ATPase
MMLDAKATFDELVARQAPDEESRDRVLNNRIYQQISNALAGSQEYMAMEKLFELHTSGRFDLLVLDTPPSRDALDFLDAPKRLTQFIEGRSLRMFMRPTGLAARVAGRGASVALGVLKRIVGFDLLADLAEFFNAFSGMVDGFQARAKRVNSLLADPHTCFLVVCGPQGEPIDEAVYFHRKLVEAKLPFGGVIVNKVHYPAERLRGDGAEGRDLRDPQAGPDFEGVLAAKLGDDDLARRVAENFADYQALAERDARNIEHLAAELRTKGVIRVPYLDEDVHDLGGLTEINRYLFASSEERIELAAGHRDAPGQPARS